MSSLFFESIFHVLVTQQVFILFSYVDTEQHLKKDKFIKKRDWISDDQIWIRNYELILISSCDSDSYGMFHVIFPDDMHDYLSIHSSKLPGSIILMQDSIAKTTIIQNYINAIDQTLN